MEESKHVLLLSFDNLRIKINKINHHIHSDEFNKLSFIEQQQTIEQSIYMTLYRDVLRDRLFLPVSFKINS